MAGYRTWQDAIQNTVVTDDWLNELEDWPEWSWPHLTDSMVNRDVSLPFRVVYAVLVERSGLPMPTRAVLQYLARRCGGANGNPRRCWPPLDTIGDRVGASRRTVQRAIDNAEAQGWVRVVRHSRAPSDYVLDVPNLEHCPCRDCTNPKAVQVRDEEHDLPADLDGDAQEPDALPQSAVELRQTRKGVGMTPQGVRATPLGVTESPQAGQRVTPRVSESHTHLVHSLGSSPLQALDSDHQRRPSVEGTATKTDEPSTSRKFDDLDGDQQRIWIGKARDNYSARLGQDLAAGATHDQLRPIAARLYEQQAAAS